jgi:hypothetical protein
MPFLVPFREHTEDARFSRVMALKVPYVTYQLDAKILQGLDGTQRYRQQKNVWGAGNRRRNRICIKTWRGKKNLYVYA